jgi:glycine/D-amino acid oxidase-like deaminating enzyme
VGSTEEEVGFNKQTTAKGIQELLAFAVELVPALADVAIERCWAGLRPASRDHKPILGSVTGFENLFVATGHFRSGLQLSAISGILMKQLMLDKTPEEDLTPFRVDRF